MTKIVKDGAVMVARDGNQLAAFLNNGWTVDSDGKITTGQVTATNITPPQTDGKKTYTKTEINRLSTAELQALALENGIDGANEMTGAELKKVLIEKFGL